MVELQLWHKVVLYVLILGSLFVYVKLSNLKINNVPLLRKEYRILAAVFFPLIIIGAFLIGSILAGVALVVVASMFLYTLFTKKKLNIRINARIPRRPLN